MKNTWRHYLRRLAATSVVGGSMAWCTAVCYAQQAYDDASDPIYNNGWQEGDDGGTGSWGPWNFDGTFRRNPIPGEDDLPDDGNQQAMDLGTNTGAANSSPYNNIGEAWTMFNLRGPIPGPPPEPNDTDIAQAGRAIIGENGLQVGSTLKIVVDNPTEESFYRGWTIRLNNGGANGCYAGDNCTTPIYEPEDDPDHLITTRMAIGTFEYYSYGRWYAGHTDEEGDPDTGPDLYNTQTDRGLQIEFTLTDINTFNLKMIPLDDPDNYYEALNRTMNDLDDDGPDGPLPPYPSGLPIDWIEFEFYNTDSDTYPAIVQPGPVQADYSNNGFVDAADYVGWRKMNGTGFDLLNEVPGATPGNVTDLDYDKWREHFADEFRTTDFYIRSMEIVDPGGSSSGVPEPSTFVYLVAGAAGLASQLRRKNRTNDLST
jgi:hypothetical protein